MSYHHQSSSRDLSNAHKKRKRISYESEELAWTAARCSRLLRCITHRIGALRTLAKNSLGAETLRPLRTAEKRVASHWSTQDPVWIGDAKRKSGAKTFAGKKKPVKQRPAPQTRTDTRIAFPSPFIRRTVFGGAASPRVPFVRPAPLPPRSTRQLPIKAGSPRIEAEKGLLSALGSIINATNGKMPRRLQGARSLMSTCLRNVPQYIAMNEGDDEDVDFTLGILSYLEEYGTKENGGWGGLREVVRSQAVFAVCEAIEDGVLSDKIAQELIEQCGRQEAIPEAQQILTVWLSAGESVSPKQIETLNTFAREQNCAASSFRLMCAAAKQDWKKLASFSKSSGLWNNLLRSLASHSHHDAEAFLSISVRSFMNQGISHTQDLNLGLKETILRLTAMAASSMPLNNAQTDYGSMSHIVHRLTADVALTDRTHPIAGLHRLLISCSLFLLGVSSDCNGLFDPSDLSSLLNSTSKAHFHSSDFAAELISTISILEQHLHSDLSGFLIERMIERASVAPLYRQIALAAVTAKQQASKSDQDEALLAEYIERISFPTLEGTAKTPRTPFEKNRKAQYRWEEGISEWVTKTPFTAAAGLPPTPLSFTWESSSIYDKENQAPSQIVSCGSVKRNTCLPQNSPDVLAMSPKFRALVESPLNQQRGKRACLSRTRTVPPTQETRRRTRRLSDEPRAAEDSADELGF